MPAPNFLALPVSYTVKSGDSLSKISLTLYGDYKYYTDLARLNGMADPNLLAVGAKILVYAPLSVSANSPDSGGSSYTLSQAAAPIAKPAVAPKPEVPQTSSPSKSATVMKNILTDWRVITGVLASGIAAVMLTQPKRAAALIKPNPLGRKKHHVLVEYHYRGRKYKKSGDITAQSPGHAQDIVQDALRREYGSDIQIGRFSAKLKRPVSVALNPRFKRSTRIQSYRFDKDLFTLKQARAWLKKHGVKAKAPDVTKSQYRFRVESPRHFKNFRIKELAAGIQSVIAEPKKGY
jgi:hypothetical protein